MSLDKVKALFYQAERDLEISCYDKCISSSYFACRMMAELYLRGRGIRHLPRRDDKLANLLSNLGLKKEADSLLFLYGLRKRADYGKDLSSEDEAREAVITAKSFLRSLCGKMGLKFWVED